MSFIGIFSIIQVNFIYIHKEADRNLTKIEEFSRMKT